MTLTVIKVRSRWMYQSEVPQGTRYQVSHEIHVPDQIVHVSIDGPKRYKLQPHPMNLLSAPLTAESLVNLAHSGFASQVYIVTTVI